MSGGGNSVDVILGEHLDELWLNTIHRLPEVVDLLTIEEGRNELRQYVQFIKFLEQECTGKHLTNDRQWGELLNLMQISKKLNHRTVKFRDILKSKVHIEANAAMIRKFNAEARHVGAIGKSLEDLQRWINLSKLKLSFEGQIHLIEELKEAKSHLVDKCQQIVRALKVELQVESIRQNKSYEDWSHLLATYDTQTSLILTFLTRLLDLQRGLLQLEPLLKTTNDKLEQTKIGAAIASCQRQYSKLRALNDKIVQILIGTAKKARGSDSLQLTRLLNGKSQLIETDKLSVGLEKGLDELKSCTNCLYSIIQTLRLEYGRFYFVNDLELLTIIGLDLDLVRLRSALQSRLICKLFNGSFDGFQLDANGANVIGVTCPSGQCIKLKESVIIKKPINLYSIELVRVLNEVVRKLRRTLRDMLLEYVGRDEEGKLIDVELPLQLLVVSERIKFCRRFESEMAASPDKSSIEKLIQFYNQRLNDASIIKNEESQLWSTLTSINVLFISILEDLRRNQVSSTQDWHWTKQTRYYLEGQQVVVRILDTKFEYKFDLLSGLEAGSKRLVETDTTRRCFLLAAQAVANWRLGANPFGPAGSGKTETIKALGTLLGCQVVVHNCDESNDASAMDRLIWGLAQTGLWGCFDEFNRLSASVLSSASATLELVQASIRENKSTIELDHEPEVGLDSMRCIDKSCAFFITLNPGGDKTAYRGRRKLPANLRCLFPPIAMFDVHIATIVRENLLVFSMRKELNLSIAEANLLGSKVQNWMDQMRKQKQLGCEWDLRFFVATMKRLELLLGRGQSESIEKLLALSIALEAEPRVGHRDAHMLHNQTEQIFGHRSDGVRTEVDKLQLQLESRAGVLLLGKTGAGKSRAWQSLKESKSNLVKVSVLNPRACNEMNLFGHFTNDSKPKWVDGLFTNQIRQALTALHNEEISQFWLVLDGPVDPDWVESLNSVLDDNQVLTLSSGERLNFVNADGKCIKLILETDDIKSASPATISRLGLVYFDSEIGEATMMDKFPVVTGASYMSRLSKVSELLEDGPKSQFHCNECTKVDSLLQFLCKESGKSRTLVIDNLHLLPDDEKWGHNSCVELIRFIISYGGFYDTNHDFRRITCKLIVTTADMRKLGDRLGRISQVIDCAGSVNDPTPPLEDGDEPTIFRGNQSIMTFSTQIIGSGRRQRLLEVISSDWNVAHFTSSNEMRESIAKLLDLSANPSQTSMWVFILTDWELAQMDEALRVQLFECLGELKESSCPSLKFVYLAHELSSDQIDYWQSVGCLFFAADRCRCLVDLQIEDGQMNQRFNEQLCKYLEGRNFNFRNHSSLRSICDLFAKFFERLRTSYLEQHEILTQGLKSLGSLDDVIRDIKQKCEQDRLKLLENKKDIESLMQTVDTSMKGLQVQQVELDKTSRALDDNMKLTTIKTKQLEKRLANVKPLIENSKQEVNRHLNPEALNEIKSLRQPPKTIKDILDVLCILLQVEDTSWPNVKAYLARKSLREVLTNYNFKENLSKSLIIKARSEMKSRKSSFDLKQASKASSAVVPILKWIEAALEYGDVLTEVGPLTDEMETLKQDKERMEQTLQDLARRRSDTETAVADDRRKLSQLQNDYTKSDDENKLVIGRLQDFQKFKSELDEQATRWQSKLQGLNLISTPEQQAKVCLILTLFVHGLGGLDSLLQTFKLSSLDSKSLIEYASALHRNHLTLQHYLQTGNDDANLVANLFAIEILMDLANQMVFVMADEASLESLLTFDEVLCRKKDLAIIQVNRSLTESIDQIKMSAQLGKLVVIQLGDKSHALLDVLKLHKQMSPDVGRRLVLTGSSKILEQLSNKVHHVNLSKTGRRPQSDSESKSDVESRVLDIIAQVSDSDLVKMLDQSEQELKIEQGKVASLQSDFLARLGALDGGNDPDSRDILFKSLTELGSSSRSIAGKIQSMQTTLGDLKSRRDRCSQAAKYATDIYLSSLAYSNDDTFSKMNLNLLGSFINSTNGSPTLNATMFTRNLMYPMRLDQRQKFRATMAGSRNEPCQIQQALRDLINLPDASKLMIVMHGTGESSPQSEIDKFMRQQGVTYEKIYATDDMRNWSYQSCEVDKYFCIANAQIAADWINENLAQIISQGGCKVILVAEQDSTADGYPFGQFLTSRAIVKFWHDEMALPVEDRFIALCEILDANLSDSCELYKLGKQLILLHVILQEYCHKDGFWTKNYSFESDQVRLAIRCLRQLEGGAGNVAGLRYTSYLYLRHIIYGARMETQRDEIKLDELLKQRFVCKNEADLAREERRLDSLMSISGPNIIKKPENHQRLAQLLNEILQGQSTSVAK